MVETLSAGLRNLLKNQGPFCVDGYDPSDEVIEDFLNYKVLCIGAGGLGCELLKSLALSGFRNIDVIDMDTIDVSNLNRQFLFRKGDVGKPKSVCAANFIKRRCPECNITAHFCKIQDMPDDFYMTFALVLGGLDSVKARNWISEKLVQLNEQYGVQIPYIDGGTERWRGHVKYIMPGMTACMECQSVLFPPEISYQMCTIANFPRSPEHCIAWAQELEWPIQRKGETFDGDNDEHIEWVLAKAIEHGREFGITEGFSAKLAKGVTKNIIPAIASTQAIIAAWCTTEALKYLTCAGPVINNNILYSGDEGIHATQFEFARNPDCRVCGRKFETFPKVEGETVRQLMARLAAEKGLTNASLRTADRSIYMGSLVPELEVNLDKPIESLIGPDSIISAVGGGKTFEFSLVPK